MKERPILFTTGNIQAILEDRKTQTRRIIKPQPILDYDSGYVFWGNRAFDIHGLPISVELPLLSPYQPGMVLWVRETFAKTGDNWHDDWPGHGDYYYKADDPWNEVEWPIKYPKMKRWYTWRPSIFMPKEACRIRLQVEEVNVERLRDISDEDCKAEGLTAPMITDHSQGGWYVAYKALWESINGKGSWNKNPWVWVIKFKRI
jgi:hypothetical protein